jgi:flagellar hook-associated protein 2
VANASIGGLSSGLDTAGIIDALMRLEAAPQQRLQTRVGTEQSTVTKLQGLNTRTSVLASRAETLASATAWARMTASSTDSSVRVTASGEAQPTRLAITVEAVATTHQLGFTDAHALDDVVTGASTIVRLDRFDGTPVDLETGDGSLSALVAAINDNANETGLRASAVRVGTDQYRLLVESVKTGEEQDFTLTTLAGGQLLGGQSVRAAADARINLGAGLTVTSATTTFTDLLPGVSVTLASSTTVGTTATVTVARDTTGATTSVKDLVDQLNTVLTEISSLTSFDAQSKKSGVLSGDPGVRSLRSALLEAVYPTDGGSMATVGIELDRNGKLTFDEELFAEAYAADPAGVAALFTAAGDGFASRMEKVAGSASDPTDGTISQSISGRREGIARLESGIEDWDRRLELRRTSLERQYAALEVALSQMSTQSSWLSSQLAGLNKSNQG